MYLVDKFYSFYESLDHFRYYIDVHEIDNYEQNDNLDDNQNKLTNNNYNPFLEFEKITKNKPEKFNNDLEMIIKFLIKENEYLSKLSEFESLTVDDIILKTNIKNLIEIFKNLKEINDKNNENWNVVVYNKKDFIYYKNFLYYYYYYLISFFK